MQGDHSRKMTIQQYLGNDTNAIAIWDKRITPNMTAMSGPRYDHFLVDPETGKFRGQDLNLTIVLLFVKLDSQMSQYVADQFLIVQKQMKYKNIKICWVDPINDEMMFDTFGRYRSPQIVAIDTKDGMAYYYDQIKVADNETMIDWLSNKNYKSSSYKI